MLLLLVGPDADQPALAELAASPGCCCDVALLLLLLSFPGHCSDMKMQQGLMQQSLMLLMLGSDGGSDQTAPGVASVHQDPHCPW